MDIKFIVINPLRDLGGRFHKAEGRILQLRRTEFLGGMRQLVQFLKQEAPSKTGKFRSGIGFRTQMMDKNITGYTYAPEPLASFIKTGTRAHPIVAKRGGVLSFLWPNGPAGGGRYFFRKVRHPGTKANPYHQRALKAWIPLEQTRMRKIALSYRAFLMQ